MNMDNLSISELTSSHSSSAQSNQTENKLAKLSKKGKTIPPVTSWKPTHHFDMDLVIKANGEWWHEGVKIIKPKLIALFASILYCEIDSNTETKEYFLQTPVEKAKIQVEDVPLMIISVEQFYDNDMSWLQFCSNTGDIINSDAEHPVFMQDFTDAKGLTQSRAYIRVRENLVAFINRNTFFHLIELGQLTETEQRTSLTLNSGGSEFQLIQVH